jgi:hypothetical protein
MRMQVVHRGMPANVGLKRYVGLRLMSALDQFEPHVAAVTVLLYDGPAGKTEVGSRCRIVARIVSEAEVAVEHAGDELYASIDGAAERLAEVVREQPLRLVPNG